MTLLLPEGFVVDSVVGRRISWDDLEDLSEMHADPAVMATLGGIRDHAQTVAYLERNLAHWERYGFGIYGLRDGKTGQFMGRAGLRWVPVAGTEEIEVAYALCAGAWGRGLATAICKELVALGGRAELADQVVAYTLPSNRGSRRVMEKSGFAYEREFDHNGTPHVLYRRSLGD
jgi:[ribosomal protein S5]-alanine N-acetyltransferase